MIIDLRIGDEGKKIALLLISIIVSAILPILNILPPTAWYCFVVGVLIGGMIFEKKK